RPGEIYYATFNARHRWQYFPEMRPQEVIRLKNYDSAKDGRARFTPHAAFLHPAAPPAARPRESIAVRTIAFFDNCPRRGAIVEAVSVKLRTSPFRARQRRDRRLSLAYPHPASG